MQIKIRIKQWCYLITIPFCNPSFLCIFNLILFSPSSPHFTLFPHFILCIYVSTALLVRADLEVSFSLSAEINVLPKVLITRLRWEVGLGKDESARKTKVKGSFCTECRERDCVGFLSTIILYKRQRTQDRITNTKLQLFSTNSAVW